MHAVIVSSDTLFGFKHRTYIIRRFKALLLTMMLLVIVVFTMISVSSGLTMIRFASIHVIDQFVFSFLRLLKWPGILLFLFLMIKVVHIVTPRQRIPGKYTNIGALFTTLLWGGVTLVYTFYLNHFNNSYTALFGDFANMIVLMMWMYILSYVFVLGIAINAYFYKKGTIRDGVN
jgi:membrane protein